MLALKKLLCAGVVVLLLEALCFAAAPRRFEFVEVHMGTQFKIILYAPNQQIAQQAAQKAFHRIARLDAIMSDYRETSELNQFCHKAVKKPVKLSRNLFRVLAAAQNLAARSDGAFDVTVGVVVRLWRHARRTNEMPDKARLAQALALTGYKKLHLDAKTQTAWLEQPGMLLDLGGIAKGFAADAAMRVLKQQGIRSALIAAGGDIVVSDAPPQKRGWLVAIAPLRAEQVADWLYLCNAAVSTSGDAQQFVEFDGARYSHIVDPRTGVGLLGQSSITVVAGCGTDADGLATAASVLGAERGVKLIEATKGAAALMIKKSARGLERLESKRWQEVSKSSKVSP